MRASKPPFPDLAGSIAALRRFAKPIANPLDNANPLAKLNPTQVFERIDGAMQQGIADATGVLTAVGKGDFADAGGRIDAAVKARISDGSEQLIHALADNSRYQAEPIEIPGPDGQPGVTFKVAKEIKGGAFGIVYHLEIDAFSPEFAAQNPQLFADGKPRTDLVVKFPQNLPMRLPGEYDPKTALLTEIDDGAFFDKVLGDEPIPGASVLFSSKGDPIFAVKAFVVGQDIESLAKSQGGQLSAPQKKALERDIFNKAKRIFDETGVGLDIKPKNLAWDAANERWVMYEQTRLPEGIASFHVGRGFGQYMRVFEGLMAQAARS
jgi:hypothetical protein